MKKTLLILGLVTFCFAAQSQVLITLLLGDKLNSDKIEFGLIGGMNRSYWLEVDDSEALNHFNLGFYFHILLKNNSYFSTGVLVKSSVGATGMETYSIGDPEFDSVFEGGELTTKINYFYVPMMFHQRFNNRWYLEGGINTGVRNYAWDIFEKEDYDGDLSYKTDVRDDYTRLDFGLMGTAGYKLSKEVKSLSVGISYYYGLIDVSKADDVSIKNSSLYFFCKIPIGAGGKKEAE